jgi:hypothetical protein
MLRQFLEGVKPEIPPLRKFGFYFYILRGRNDVSEPKWLTLKEYSPKKLMSSHPSGDKSPRSSSL